MTTGDTAQFQGSDIYVHESDTETHTVTFWHAEIGVYWPAPGGGSYYKHYRCTHNHDSNAAAKTCGKRLARLARQRQGDVSALRWVVER